MKACHGNRYSWKTRQEVYRRLTKGDSALSITAALGVSRITIARWSRLAGMTYVLGRGGGVVLPTPASPGRRCQVRKYRRLTLQDRSFIQAARVGPNRLSMRQIASEIGVAPSTVSREVARLQLVHAGQYRYDASAAHHHALLARKRARGGKLEDPWLRASVVAGLNAKHSPQQVAHRLQLEYPNEPERQVSHETIYQALYVQGKGALRHELTVWKALRSGRTTRVPQSKLPRRSNRPWLEGARLSDRPAEVEDRAVPGHWEGDLVVGPKNSGLVTLVERQTRFALVGRLPGVRDSMSVTELMQRMIRSLPSEFVKTITWDQGQEMALHRQFTVATGCEVFFCDPHAPWQRGSNENLNGLIRDFYPKGTNFNNVSDDDIVQMQELLNDRPRKTLDFYTPREKLEALVRGVAIAP